MKQSGIRYSILRPGTLNEEKSTGATLAQGDDQSWPPTSRHDVALVTVACVLLVESDKKTMEVASSKTEITPDFPQLFGVLHDDDLST